MKGFIKKFSCTTAIFIFCLRLTSLFGQDLATSGVLVEMMNRAVVGAWSGGNWIPSHDVVRIMKKGDRIRLLSFDSIGTETVVIDIGAPSGPVLQGAIGVEIDQNVTQEGFGFIGDHNPLPRKPVWTVRKGVPTASTTDSGIVLQLKTELGLQATDSQRLLRINDWVQVDLDNDGMNDTLVIASNWMPDDQGLRGVRKGDASIILFAKKEKGGFSFYPFWKNIAQKDFSPEDEQTEMILPSLEGVYDINGDGLLEIVIEVERYEAGDVEVFDFSTGNLLSVLEISYGI